MTTPSPPRLVVLGDLLLDIVVTPERPVERGTDVPGRISFRRGGSAANVAAAFVRAGGTATLITSLGDDRLGGRLAASLRADGVRVRAVRQRTASGLLAALVDERGERSFVTQRGAADLFRPADLAPGWLRGADILHVPAYSLFAEPIGSAAVHAAAAARQAGILVSADLSSRGPLVAFGVRRACERLAELAPTVLFANRDEAAAILHQAGRRAWPGLLARAPLAVVKDGAWGCRVLWRDLATDALRQLDVAAQRVGRVDTTGAGDAFAAGFLFELASAGGLSAGRRDPGGWRDPVPWPDLVLRRAAMAGHQAAAEALRSGRPEVDPW